MIRTCYPLFAALSPFLAVSAWAADDTLTMTYTTATANGQYKPLNVIVVYLTDGQNKFITTVGNGTNATRALWGNARAHDLAQWFAANPSTQPDIDARTGATQTAYKTYTVSWNWKKRDGSEVPDGTYKLKFELTDDNENKNKFNRTEFAITKGRTAWKVGPVTQGGYQDVVLNYEPAKPIQVVCEPAALDFGTVAIGLQAEQAFAIVNSNSAGVTITNLQITGQDKPVYSLVSAPAVPFTVSGAGPRGPARMDIWVRFRPDVARTFNEAKIEVAGQGLAPIAPVLLRGQGVQLPAAIAVSTEGLAFPQVLPGQSARADLAIANAGPGVLQVTSLKLVGLDAAAYSLADARDGPLEILPGQGPFSVTIRFTPLTYRTYGHAALAIASNDPNRPVTHVALAGEGGPLTAERMRVLSGIGSRCRAIALHGTRAVTGRGLVLSVDEVADRDGPFRVGNTVLPGIIEDVGVTGDTAAAALGSAGFALVGLREVGDPVVLAVADTEGFCHATATADKRLCVADGPGGLLVYDVSTPAEPRLVHVVPGDIVAVVASGDKAVCLDPQAGLRVVDIRSAQVLGQDPGLVLGQAITAEGQTAYVADRTARFFVVDCSNAAQPTVVGQAQLAAPPRSLAVTGTTVCAAAGPAGVLLIDVANPLGPVACPALGMGPDTVDVAANAVGVYAVDQEAGLCDFRLPVDGCQMNLRRISIAGIMPLDVAVDADLAFVAGAEAGLWIYGMTDTASPKVRGAWIEPVQAVAAAVATACAACGPLGLKVLDVSRPALPRLLGSLAMDGFADRVAYDGRLALIGTGDAVRIVDMADPCRPVYKAAWPAHGHVLNVTLDRGLGFVACGDRGLVILAEDGAVAGTLDTPGVAYEVLVSNGLAYVADGPAGIQVVDVAHPASPQVLATIHLPGPALSLAGRMEDLFVAGPFGVWQLDASHPSSLVVKGTSASPGQVASLAVLGSSCLCADPRAGLIVLAGN